MYECQEERKRWTDEVTQANHEDEASPMAGDRFGRTRNVPAALNNLP
jgi:hypothetical protein